MFVEPQLAVLPIIAIWVKRTENEKIATSVHQLMVMEKYFRQNAQKSEDRNIGELLDL